MAWYLDICSYLFLICKVYENLHKHIAGLSEPRISKKPWSRRWTEHSKYFGVFFRDFTPFLLPRWVCLIWVPCGHMKHLVFSFSLLVYLLPVKIMGNLNLNENLKVAEAGRSWSYSWECQYWISSPDQSHSLFHGSFWKLFRIKQVEEKSALCQTAGCCLNTHQGKAVKLTVSPDTGPRAAASFWIHFHPFLPKRNEVAKRKLQLILSFLWRCSLTQLHCWHPWKLHSEAVWNEGV